MSKQPRALQLSNDFLSALPTTVARPRYDRRKVGVGIVHLGIGAFHRAHQAVYIDDLLNRKPTQLGICGVSLRSPSVRDRLMPQNGLYTMIIRDGREPSYRVIGSVKEVLVAPENPETVIRRMVDESTRLITLTVTEKGYCLNAARHIDLYHPDIISDLKSPEKPCTVVGFLAAALRLVRKTGAEPPVILCCDNLPANGKLLRSALLEFAAASDSPFAKWIEKNVPFPSSMIDRIVPATNENDLNEARAALGLVDHAAIVAEPFSQWVVEDCGGTKMPDLSPVGVDIVSDVAPIERMKLRLLNGAHSTLAYLSQLASVEYVADAVARPYFTNFLVAMMRAEIAPTLAREIPRSRLDPYIDQLITRFSNPAIRHRTAQIAMDGSQKLPQRLLSTISDRLRVGAPIDRMALGVAAWMRYLGGISDSGEKFEISDPRAEELKRWADRNQPPERIVDNFLDASGIFTPDLSGHADLRRLLTMQLGRLTQGADQLLRSQALQPVSI